MCAIYWIPSEGSYYDGESTSSSAGGILEISFTLSNIVE